MSKLDDACYGSPIRPWMGRYPRKGADWSPEEDQALLRAHESGRYLTKQLAARHLREPVAIERRLDALRVRVATGKTPTAARPERNWQTERETAQQAVAQIKKRFSASMWPRKRQPDTPPHKLDMVLAPDGIKVRPGDVVGLFVSVSESYNMGASLFYGVPLTDLPPEVAQALQFGGEA